MAKIIIKDGEISSSAPINLKIGGGSPSLIVNSSSLDLQSGYLTIPELIDQPELPPPGRLAIYASYEDSKLYYKNDFGDVYQISSGGGSESVNFKSISGSVAKITGSTVQVTGSLFGSQISGTTAQFTNITGTIVVPAGNQSNPSISFLNDSNTGIYSPSSDSIAVTQGGSQVLKIDSSGNITASIGNIVIGTAGKGIDFSVIPGGTSKILDDYEEGNWTPSVFGVDVSGTQSYSTRTANYTKIGNLVTVQCSLSFSCTNAQGQMKITGLPFTPQQNTNISFVPCIISSLNNSFTTTAVTALLNSNNNDIRFYEISFETVLNTNSWGLPYNISNTGSNSISFAVTYFV